MGIGFSTARTTLMAETTLKLRLVGSQTLFFWAEKRLKIEDKRLPDIFIYYMMLVCHTTEVLMSDCFFLDISDGSGRKITDFEPWIEIFNWDQKTTSSSSRSKSDSKKSPDYLGFQLGHCCRRICCFLTLILTSVSFLLIRDAVLLSRIDGRTPGASEDWLVKCSKKRCGGHMSNIDVMFLKHPLPLSSSVFEKRIPTQLNSSIQRCFQNHFETTTPFPQFYPHSTTISTANVLFSRDLSSQFFHGKWLQKAPTFTGEVAQGSICWKMVGLDRSCLQVPGIRRWERSRAGEKKKPTEKSRLN